MAPHTIILVGILVCTGIVCCKTRQTGSLVSDDDGSNATTNVSEIIYEALFSPQPRYKNVMQTLGTLEEWIPEFRADNDRQRVYHSELNKKLHQIHASYDEYLHNMLWESSTERPDLPKLLPKQFIPSADFENFVKQHRPQKPPNELEAERRAKMYLASVIPNFEAQLRDPSTSWEMRILLKRRIAREMLSEWEPAPASERLRRQLFIQWLDQLKQRTKGASSFSGISLLSAGQVVPFTLQWHQPESRKYMTIENEDQKYGGKVFENLEQLGAFLARIYPDEKSVSAHVEFYQGSLNLNFTDEKLIFGEIGYFHRPYFRQRSYEIFDSLLQDLFVRDMGQFYTLSLGTARSNAVNTRTPLLELLADLDESFVGKSAKSSVSYQFPGHESYKDLLVGIVYYFRDHPQELERLLLASSGATEELDVSKVKKILFPPPESMGYLDWYHSHSSYILSHLMPGKARDKLRSHQKKIPRGNIAFMAYRAVDQTSVKGYMIEFPYLPSDRAALQHYQAEPKKITHVLSMQSVLEVGSLLNIPLSLSERDLVSLEVRDSSDQRQLVEGKDYQLLIEPESGRIFLESKVAFVGEIQAGLAPGILNLEQTTNIDRILLNSNAITELANRLETQAGARLLAASLRERHQQALSDGTGLTPRDLSELIRNSSIYSPRPRHHQDNVESSDRLAYFRKFVNPRTGVIHCQCDGANELQQEMSNELIADAEVFEARNLSVLVVDYRGNITQASGHLVTEYYQTLADQTKRRLGIVDATPKLSFWKSLRAFVESRLMAPAPPQPLAPINQSHEQPQHKLEAKIGEIDSEVAKQWSLKIKDRLTEISSRSDLLDRRAAITQTGSPFTNAYQLAAHYQRLLAGDLSSDDFALYLQNQFGWYQQDSTANLAQAVIEVADHLQKAWQSAMDNDTTRKKYPELTSGSVGAAIDELLGLTKKSASDMVERQHFKNHQLPAGKASSGCLVLSEVVNATP